MANYMLLLYSPDADRDQVAERTPEREAELAEWRQRYEEMAASGAMLATGRLKTSDTATTVRLKDGETELTDGPFAVTKEVLAGYFLVDVPDLDEAVKLAERLPIARYGSVEVRPVWIGDEVLDAKEASAQAGS